LKGVYDTGCRHFDTAEIYAAGDKYNEAILGEFFQTVPRDSFSVATKYYPKEDNAHVYSYDTVKSCLLASLKRLKLDYVDLYYAHRVLTLEGGKTFAKAAQRLKEEGLIREIGLSEVSGKWLREIYNDGAPIDAVQQEWSLLTRSLESELVPVCKELDVPIVAYRYVAVVVLCARKSCLGSIPSSFSVPCLYTVRSHETCWRPNWKLHPTIGERICRAIPRRISPRTRPCLTRCNH
jgi:aryl-alcohol dehydrogenase-like predicted oxidoreductase